MAELIKVKINISVQQEKLILEIPETTRVPIGSIVQWDISGFANLLNEPQMHRGRGLIFTLYFSDKSPFLWKRQFVQLHHSTRFFPYYLSNIVRLAEDIADEKGDFKYGVKVTEGESDETLFDEDPYLIVF